MGSRFSQPVPNCEALTFEGNVMELQTNEEIISTTHYWGYRELTAAELICVSGGSDGDGDGTGGDTAGSNYDGANYDSGSGELHAGFWTGVMRGVQGWLNDNGLGTPSNPPPEGYGYPGGLRGDSGDSGGSA
jgi:hypothetical protein